MTPYPTRDKIEEIFYDRVNPEKFKSYLVDHVDARVVGQEFQLSGHHNSIEAFHEEVWVRGTSMVKMETLRVEVNRVIGGEDSAWAAVHSTGTATAKSGKPIRLELVDLVRFNSDHKIAQLIEFFDTKHHYEHLNEHESSQTKEETTDKS